jgi:hypothetical protein
VDKKGQTKRKGVSVKQSGFIVRSLVTSDAQLYFLLVDNISKLIYILRKKRTQTKKQDP